MAKHERSREKLPPFIGNGILLIDKPAGWTSFDVVAFLRSRFSLAKIGHCGTLDPAATGLLVIVIGKYTKLSERLSGADKTYETTILFGTETDSMDLDGTITAMNGIGALTPELAASAINSFVGAGTQIPPMVSAIQVNGQRLYSLARQGIEIEREPRPVTINSIAISEITLPYAKFTVTCSKGTYIRVLCSDIGKRAGCGAMLHALRRTRSGDFNIADAVSLDEAKKWSQPQLSERLREVNFSAF